MTRSAQYKQACTPITPSTASALLLLKMKFLGGEGALFLPLLATTEDIASLSTCSGSLPRVGDAVYEN